MDSQVVEGHTSERRVERAREETIPVGQGVLNGRIDWRVQVVLEGVVGRGAGALMYGGE